MQWDILASNISLSYIQQGIKTYHRLMRKMQLSRFPTFSRVSRPNRNAYLSRFPTFSRVSRQLWIVYRQRFNLAFLHSVGYQDSIEFHHHPLTISLSYIQQGIKTYTTLKKSPVESRFPTFSRVSRLIEGGTGGKEISLSYIQQGIKTRCRCF